MGLTYTILAGLCTIGAVIFTILAYNADKSDISVSPSTTSTTNINVSGDYVNRDKINKVIKESKPKQVTKKEEPIQNNGIINNGVNNGTQTVNNVTNNYNDIKKIRHLDNEDIEYIKTNMPLDYNISISYENSTDENVDFTNEIYNHLKKVGYNISEITSSQVIMGGPALIPSRKYSMYKDVANKIIRLTIKNPI